MKQNRMPFLKLRLAVLASSVLGLQTQFLASAAHCTEKESPSTCLPHPKHYTAYELAEYEQILVDGNLNEEAWTRVVWTDEFVDISTNIKPRFSTRVKMRWDTQFLYIAAKLEEPQVWSNVTKHNEVTFLDNDFEVFVDPSGSTYNYKELEINARNVFWDLLLPKPYSEGGVPQCNNPTICNCCWDIQNETLSGIQIQPTGALINDPTVAYKGWTVELALPLHRYSLSPPTDDTRWRINFSRVEYNVFVKDGTFHKVPNTPENNWVWQPIGYIQMHMPERWGYVDFSRKEINSSATVSDPQWPARSALIAVFDAQRAYAGLHKGQYAKSLGELVELKILDESVVASGSCGAVLGKGAVVSLKLKVNGGGEDVGDRLFGVSESPLVVDDDRSNNKNNNKSNEIDKLVIDNNNRDTDSNTDNAITTKEKTASNEESMHDTTNSQMMTFVIEARVVDVEGNCELGSMTSDRFISFSSCMSGEASVVK